MLNDHRNLLCCCFYHHLTIVEPIEGSDKVTETDIGEVAKLIGAQDDVKTLYAHLGMKNRDVRGAEQEANTTEPTVKARNVLLKWRQMNGKKATRDEITKAMAKMETWAELIEDLEESAVWNHVN